MKFINSCPVLRGSRSAMVEQMRARPGVWFVLDILDTWSNPYAMAYGINEGRFGPFPRGEFRARVKAGVVYVRKVVRS